MIIGDWLVQMDLQGGYRRLIQELSQCLKGRRKPRKTSVEIVGDPDEIRTGHLPNILKSRCVQTAARPVVLRGLRPRS